MIAPEGDVTLCKVPWNPDYKHVCHSVMGNPSAIAGTWGVSTTHNYTFIRQDGDIKVPYNADDIYGVNYVVYNNGGKAFCCFVTSVTYVSNNTTLLHLVEDVWQTWGGDIDWHACFVAREHVDSDEIGEHILAEPAFQVEQECVDGHIESDLNSRVVVVLTTAVPKFKPGQSDYFVAHGKDDFDGQEPVGGGWYNGVLQGACAFGFTQREVLTLNHFLDNLQLCGAGDAICAIFMMPSLGVSIDANHKIIKSAGEYTTLQTWSFAHTCGNGYVPRNKKLLTYPYSYLNVTDHNGVSMDYQFEKFGGEGTFSNRNNIGFFFKWGMEPSGSVVFYPANYKDSGTGVAASYPVTVQCSWYKGSYSNWLAQNAGRIEQQNLMNYVGFAGGLIAAVAGVLVTIATGGAAAAAVLPALAGLGVATNAGLNIGKTEKEVEAQSKVPNQLSGAATSNSMFIAGLNNIEFRNISLREDFASSIDDFFDQFGYEVDVLKVPNVTGRRSWNYVKTVGANVGGDIPADRLAVINECLDAGITFWHTGDVGNYGLSNEIV